MKKRLSQTALYGEILTLEQQYTKDLGVVVPLTPDQEQCLLDRALKNDVQAKDEMIVSCLPYVKNIASSYARNYKITSPRIEYLELVQIGNLAIVEKFDDCLNSDQPSGLSNSPRGGEKKEISL
ncbi:hypothetical protein [Dictyobacter arantiisoli]|uniref:Uncharacterized protein n=1 Tax=Dictyobacter arantiisoli TaxID=2014874 RepID=A0A5A5TGA8_9CHLR|nr:hypothetical protein [Dictyobacter arantiisoli]GCF10610.1 hypothetical protein KDI_41740 [Dictyobacter arantiisoli]